MSLPWSSKGVKATPIGADELMILDSADANLSTKNKRITISSLTSGAEIFTWTADHSMAIFKLTATAANNVILNAPDTQGVSIEVDTTEEYLFNATQADFKTNNIVNLGTLNTNTIPAGTDTFAMLGAGQTFTGLNIFRQNDVACIIDGDIQGGASFNATSFNDTPNAGGFFDGSKARGSLATPVAVQLDDLLSGMSGLGHTGSDFEQAGFSCFIADGTFTPTSSPGRFDIFTTPSGSVTPILRLTVGSNGTVSFNSNDITNVVTLNTHTIPVGTSTFTLQSDNLSVFASTTSAELAGVISDETGSGSLVFGTSPIIVTPTIVNFTSATHDHQTTAGGGLLLSTAALSDTADITYLNTANTFGAFLQNFVSASMRIPLSDTPTMAVDGDFAIDTLVTNFSHGIIKYFDGEELGVVSMPIIQFVTPTDGDVIAYNTTNDEFELVPSISGEVFTWTATHSMATFKLTATAGNDAILNAPSGQGVSIEVGGIDQYLFNVTQADFNGNSIINATINASLQTLVSNIDETMQTVDTGAADTVLTSNGMGSAPSYKSVAGTGDVTGPDGAVNNVITRFDGGTGKLIKSGAGTIDDNANMAEIRSLIFDTFTASPGPSTTHIALVNNDFHINTITGNNVQILIEGDLQYKFDIDALDMEGNNIDDVGSWTGRGVANNFINLADPNTLADDTTLGEIRWRGDDGLGVTVNYARIIGVMESDVDTTEDGSMQFFVQEAGAEVAYMSMNDASTGTIDILKSLNMNGQLIDNVLSLTMDGATPGTLTMNGANFRLTHAGGGSIQMRDAVGTTYEFNSSLANFMGNDLFLNDGELQFDTTTTRIHQEAGNVLQFNVDATLLFSLDKDNAETRIENNALRILESNATALFTMEANHTTPANGQIVGQLDFIDDDSIGTRRTYGEIRCVIQDPTTATEDGAIFFEVIKGGAATTFFVVNEQNGDDVEFKKNVVMDSGIEMGVGTMPAAGEIKFSQGTSSIGWDATTGFATFGLTNLDEFRMSMNGEEYLFGKTSADFKGNNLRDSPQILDSNGNELLIFTTTASAVNELTLVNAATANAIQLQATGDDADVDVRFVPKGTGTFFGNRETWAWPLTDETTLPTTGVKFTTEPAPYNMIIEDAIMGLTTAGTGATLFSIDVLKETGPNTNSFATIFSTLPTIDASEFTSTTAATPPVIPASTSWEKGQRLQLSISAIDSNSLGRGAKIELITHATAK